MLAIMLPLMRVLFNSSSGACLPSTLKFGGRGKELIWVRILYAYGPPARRPFVPQRPCIKQARRTVRGAYRSGSSAVQGHLVKPKGQLKYPAPGVQVTAGVIKGRVRFWRVVEGRWNSVKAVEMYKALEKAMAKAFPDHAARRRAKWIILEDNDPSGYKSTVAQATKVGAPAGRSELEAINQTMQAKSLSQRWVTEDTQCASQNLGRSGAK